MVFAEAFLAGEKCFQGVLGGGQRKLSRRGLGWYERAALKLAIFDVSVSVRLDSAAVRLVVPPLTLVGSSVTILHFPLAMAFVSGRSSLPMARVNAPAFSVLDPSAVAGGIAEGIPWMSFTRSIRVIGKVAMSETICEGLVGKSKRAESLFLATLYVNFCSALALCAFNSIIIYAVTVAIWAVNISPEEYMITLISSIQSYAIFAR
jgi:hypothetical protein